MIKTVSEHFPVSPTLTQGISWVVVMRVRLSNWHEESVGTTRTQAANASKNRIRRRRSVLVYVGV